MLYLQHTLEREKTFDFFEESVKNTDGEGGEYLWIQFYEKWFVWMLICKKAKIFDRINPEAVREYHKSHISKTLSISVVGMYSEESLDKDDR